MLPKRQLLTASEKRADSCKRSLQYRQRRKVLVSELKVEVRYENKAEIFRLAVGATWRDLSLLAVDVFPIAHPICKVYVDDGPGEFCPENLPVRTCKFVQLVPKVSTPTPVPPDQKSSSICLTCATNGTKCVPNPFGIGACGTCSVFELECVDAEGQRFPPSMKPIPATFVPLAGVSNSEPDTLHDDNSNRTPSPSPTGKPRQLCPHCRKPFIISNLERHVTKCKVLLLSQQG
jgi:hypothetical protein